jgi:GH15 family glucan-1,4-alpha-glucosidase
VSPDAPPISDYGLIGDTRTAALVSSDGSIDWMCAPSFDGEPVFGRLVGGVRAGRFRVAPSGRAAVVGRRYRRNTATLETTWEVDGRRVTLTEGMIAEPAGRLLPATLLVRRVTVHDGPVEVTVDFDPRLGDAHAAPRASARPQGLVCTWGSLAIALHGDRPLSCAPGAPAVLSVERGRPLTLVLAVAHHEPLIHVDAHAAWDALVADEMVWAAWTAAIDDDLPFREAIVRSLLTLRLLTYSPSGAPVAAPTTSLPEALGGARNWDYRYAWPRDASIGVGAFLGVGKDDEARMFLAWLLHASRLDRPRLAPLLTLHGRHAGAERTLEHWPGYADSRPVRMGNGAAHQHQLDTYGWVLDAGWVLTRAGQHLDSETWRTLASFVDHVVARWRAPDAGIWEIRGDMQQHVHSKLMAWMALDRGLRLAETHRVTNRRRRRWIAARDAIATEVRSCGFSTARNSYTRTYGSDDVDAAVLVLPLLDIEARDSPRVRGTIDAIRRELDAGSPLLYRYPPGRDGLPGTEGAFLPCAFWLVQALAAIGQVDEATDRLCALTDLASPLGLYAEEMEPTTLRHLGNYPQALTHAAHVQAALALRDARSVARGCTP